MERQDSTRTGEAQRMVPGDSPEPSRNKPESLQTLGQRLRSLRGRKPRDIFATELGIHKNTLARYESDERRPDASFLRQLCDYCNVASDWLLRGVPYSSENGHSDYHPPAMLQSVGPVPLLLHRDWIDGERLETSELMVTTMAGDSMRPTLDDGDVLVVQRDNGMSRVDGVHLLELDKVVTVKRIRGLGGDSVQLLSDNGGYPPLEFAASDFASGGRCRLIGRVVWHLHKV